LENSNEQTKVTLIGLSDTLPPSRPLINRVLSESSVVQESKKQENESFDIGMPTTPTAVKSKKPRNVLELDNFTLGRPKSLRGSMRMKLMKGIDESFENVNSSDGNEKVNTAAR
jgi:hypothetical protein